MHSTRPLVFFKSLKASLDVVKLLMVTELQNSMFHPSQLGKRQGEVCRRENDL